MPHEPDKSRYTGPQRPGRSSKPEWPRGEDSPWRAGAGLPIIEEQLAEEPCTPDLHRRRSATSSESVASPWGKILFWVVPSPWGKILLWVAILVGGWLLVRMRFV